MLPTWLLALLAVAAVSVVSMIGYLVLPARKMQPNSRLLLLLVSLACGAMLGNAFIHLLPESFEKLGSLPTSLGVLAGIFGCFAIEKVLRHGPWLCHANQHAHTHKAAENEAAHKHLHGHGHGGHAHGHDDEHDDKKCEGAIHPTGFLSLFSDALENFTDGIVIAVAFMVDTPTGLATTLAVVLHEIPLEIGDFAVLLNAGFSRTKAVMWNMLSALVALAGAGLVLIGGQFIQGLPSMLAPVAAGAITYMAAAGLIPQLQREENMSRSLMQLAAMALGVGLMLALLALE